MNSRRPVVIATTIRLKRSGHKGCFLVVEGRNDRLFFEQFTDRAACHIEVAEGKENVVEVIRILEDENFPGVVGVIDADFDRIEDYEWESRNLVLLETHDLEALLIRSPALDRVLIEFGSHEKIERFGHDIHDTLIAAALPIGCLRLHSRRTGLDLRFQGLRYASRVDLDSLAIDRRSLVQEVKNRSQRPELSSDELERAIRDIEHSGQDPWQICSGDDLVSILSIGLRKALGTNSAEAVRNEVLCRSLRLGYEASHFANSQLIGELRSWTERNPGFRMFR